MIFKFAFYHTITSLYIWIWAVNGILYVGFSWHPSGRVWKGWSEADLMLGSSRLAGFWASQDSRHNDHISVWAEPWWTCYSKRLQHDREHASAGEKRDTFTHWSFMMCHWGGMYIALGFEVSILTIVDISGCLDGSGSKWRGNPLMFTGAFMKRVCCRMKAGLV